MTWLSNDDHPSFLSGASRQRGVLMNWTWQDLGAEIPGKKVETPEMVKAARAREKEEAYERGFNEGLDAGRRQAMKDLSPNLRASVSVVTEIEKFRSSLVDQMNENLTVLALAVARQLMEREVSAEPEVVANLIRNALSHFPLDQKLKIHLHPVDLSSISREQSGNQGPVSAGREVRWIPDETIARGGCVVEGPERIVDGRVETALERVYRTVCNGR